MMGSRESAINEQIAGLQELTREKLLSEWTKRYGSEPYKGIRKCSLIRGIAYHMQTKIHGGLRSDIATRLLKLAEGDVKSGCGDASTLHCNKPRTQLGSRLVREWNGRTYEVLVSDNGFLLNGVTYPSLSACAKTITGAHWSGPRFFGVAS